MRKLNLSPRQIEIGLKLKGGGYRQYSAKGAEQDLQKLTGGEYRLVGYSGKYAILHKDGKAILRQETSRLDLRNMVIVALDLWFSTLDEFSGITYK